MGILPIGIIFWQYSESFGDTGFRTLDYFSLFTILSNLFAGIILILSALVVSRKIDYLRGMNATYLLIVAIVYYALLEGKGGFSYLTLSNADFILHKLMPLVLLLDFAFDRAKEKFEYKKTLLWLIFPLVFVSYSLIRGHISHWYPYDFLDPNEIGGYSQVALYCLGITLGFIIFGYGIYYINNSRRKVEHSKASDSR